jgi:mono/diheme cytochrome c family protein
MNMNMDARKNWATVTAGLGGILFLLAQPLSAAESEVGATFNMDTRILTLPVLQVGTESYNATLALVPVATSSTGTGFELRTAVLTAATSPSAATFDGQEGTVILPSVDLVQGGQVVETISAEMTRVPGSSSLLFEVADVGGRGQRIFRHETYGDERFWTDELNMHEVISSSVSPATALSVGLKVDADALPAGLLETADLEDPATTVALLKLNAVVGLHGKVVNDELVEVGVTCALCHSDVDDSVMEGIGKRLDGYANRDLDPGAILALSPAFADAESQAVLTSWGPGFYDPRFNQDGINHPVLIPPIYGLEGVPLETYTGDGPISYWNAYVAVTQMGASGVFIDPRIDVAVVRKPDLVTPRLPALLAYQVSLPAPEAPVGSFDADAAARGELVFQGVGDCASCHSGPNFTDADLRLHTAAEVGMEPLTAERSATGLYRTTPLRALWQHPPYFHDGSAATLEEVVEHYETHFSLGLTEAQKADLVEYLKSL